MTAPQLEERLRRGLRSAARAVPPRTDIDAKHASGRRRSRPQLLPATPHRRRAKRSVVAGAAAMAAAAALVFAVSARQADRPAEASLNARIIAATEQAVATSIVHVVQDNRVSPDAEMWTDETTGLARDLSRDGQGAPSYDAGPASAPRAGDEGVDDETLRTVDYCLRAYTDAEPAVPPRSGSATQWILDALAAGTMVEEGADVFDGRELVRLHHLVENDDGREERWVLVDPDSYRPVRVIGYPGTEFEYVQTYEYLDRTAENLSRLTPPVPDGFQQVDSLPGDAERLGAGC